jgi:1-acyl-sn-glycerol-3-phosphate acyltransferase
LDLPVIPVATDSGLRWGRRSFRKYPGPIHIAVGRPIPAGTRRTVLLAAIETFWRQQEAAGFPPVDNSVGDSAGLLPESLNGAPQPT